MKVLIVEDDLATRKGLEESVKDLGGETRSVGTVKDAARAVEEFDPRLLIVDIHLPDGDGIEILRAARESDPEREGIVITGQGSIDNAIEALRAGAVDYLLKPLIFEDVLHKIDHLMRHRQVAWENQILRSQVAQQWDFENLVGSSPAMRDVMKLVRRVAPTPSTVNC